MNMHGSLAIPAAGGQTTLETSSYDAYARTIAAFEEAVTAGRDPSPSGLDGLRSVELTTAIAEALRTGRTMPVTSGTP
jgi:1,5-anhydro-D-fructose reductase (1,5-anhydro-D-mannitol-forming)